MLACLGTQMPCDLCVCVESKVHNSTELPSLGGLCFNNKIQLSSLPAFMVISEHQILLWESQYVMTHPNALEKKKKLEA